MKKYDRYIQNLCDAYVQQFPLSEKYSPYMIWKMAKSQDSTVRGFLAKALVYDTGSVCAVDVLCKLAKDKDSLVRVEAIDILFKENLKHYTELTNLKNAEPREIYAGSTEGGGSCCFRG